MLGGGGGLVRGGFLVGLGGGVIWKKNKTKFWIKIPVSDSSPLSMLGGGK